MDFTSNQSQLEWAPSGPCPQRRVPRRGRGNSGPVGCGLHTDPLRPSSEVGSQQATQSKESAGPSTPQAELSTKLPFKGALNWPPKGLAAPTSDSLHSKARGQAQGGAGAA